MSNTTTTYTFDIQISFFVKAVEITAASFKAAVAALREEYAGTGAIALAFQLGKSKKFFAPFDI